MVADDRREALHLRGVYARLVAGEGVDAVFLQCENRVSWESASERAGRIGAGLTGRKSSMLSPVGLSDIIGTNSSSGDSSLTGILGAELKYVGETDGLGRTGATGRAVSLCSSCQSAGGPLW